MGMYDSVIFNCPKCGKEIEEQSKDGECILKRFNCNEVPINIAVGIKDTQVHCYSCDEAFTIVSDPIPIPVTLGMKLV